MAKIKVLDLAREVGMEDEKLLLKLRRMGVKVKEKKPAEAEKTVSPADEKIIEKDAEKEVIEKRVKPTVIRRRTHLLEAKPEPPTPPPMEVEPVLPPVGIEEKVERKVKEEKIPVEEKAAKEAKKPAKRPAGVRAVKGRKKGEKIAEEAMGISELKKEETTIVPIPAKEEAILPQPLPEEKKIEARRETEAPKRKDAGVKKPEIKISTREQLTEEEKLAALAGKKKGFVKKRRWVEEKMLVETDMELEGPPEKEVEILPRSFKPMKKKVVLKAPKKTEVTVPRPIKRIIRIAEVITVGDLAKRMGVKGGDLIKKLMEMGVLVNINQVIDADVASLAAGEFGYEVEKVSLERQELLERKEDLPEQLKPRPPVVTIMGHVDHGKTMLLDAIRKSNVVSGEAGGITQHIGAYDVQLENGHVVFIDTPGHEAFTAMRARGAQVTDIVVLVVAADDGVMPQTKEAIDHARAAKVPIVVAINKIDKPNANPEKVKKDLADYGLVPEQWGGNTLFAEVSAKQKTGIKELLELILLQAEILELKANPDKPARGVIIEAKLDKGRGPVATVLVQEGTLKTGDVFVAGSHYGRVRALLNDKGQKIERTEPSTPVEVIGFTDVPEAGDPFIVVSEERMAKQISLYRQEKIREKELSKLSKVSLEELYDKIKKGEIKELSVIIKADVQGSIEAVKEALKKISTDAVKVNVIHDAVGGITETDVNLAAASNAIIIGFNVRPGPKAQSLAEQEHVDIRTYSIIYDAIDDVKKALEGLLEPTYKEHLLGRAQVIQLFNIRKVGTVAGSVILDGKVVRGSHARILRDNVVVYDSRIGSVRRFKDDVKECSQGLECGIWIENFNDIKLGDIIESYEMEEVQPHLS
ncbi:MAG: translation initiation factor IF-2 [Thermodesulfobacteriota bacterium]